MFLCICDARRLAISARQKKENVAYTVTVSEESIWFNPGFSPILSYRASQFLTS